MNLCGQHPEGAEETVDKRPKAILFDLDDTLISLNGVADEALMTACRSFLAQREVPFDLQTLYGAIDDVRVWYWSDPERHRIGRLDLDNVRRQMFYKALCGIGHPHEDDAFELADGYGRRQQELLYIFPHSIKTLDALKLAGIKTGLITNGSAVKQRYKIEKFSLEQHFSFCLIEEEVGWGKPDLRVYERALELLDMPASDVWMVGDNLVWDVEAPQKLGIFAVWVDRRGRGADPAGRIVPDLTVSDVSELLSHIGPDLEGGI
jgi:putative hydrolase of the HAD superfamily